MAKRFKKVLVDCDLLLYKAASVGDVVTYELYNQDDELIGEFPSAADAKSTAEFLECDTRREKIVTVRDIDYCKDTFKASLRAIQKACDAESYQLYLGGDSSQNFRHNIASVKRYKSSRQQEKPTHFADLKEWIIKEYKPIIVDKIEADDRLRIDSHKDFERSKKKRDNSLCQIVVCSSDKDDLTYPSWKYNPEKNLEPIWISTPEARKWFYTMLLVGDSVDSIQGCPKIGAKTAPEILQDCKTEWDYWKVCKQCYQDAYEKMTDKDKPFYFEDGHVHYKHAYTGKKVKKTPEEIAIEMARLLWMLRTPDDMWYPPEEPK